MFKPEDIGKGNRLYFKGDKKLYHSKNIDASKRFVYIRDENGNDFKKSIKNIVQLDNKKLTEIKVLTPPKTWDFNRYIPDFNPIKIKVGDTLKLKTFIYKVSEIDEEHQSGRFFYIDGQDSGVSDVHLIKRNNSFKLSEIKVLKPVPEKIPLSYQGAKDMSRIKKEIGLHVLNTYQRYVNLGGNRISQTNMDSLNKLKTKNKDEILSTLLKDYISLNKKFV